MLTSGIREFMARDWAAVRASKDAYWRDRIASAGPLEGFRISEELRRQALSGHAAWPDPAARAEDFAWHVKMIETLRRVDAARRR